MATCFRRLRADEIDCRVATVNSKGSLMLLLFKDARVDMKLLDETYGVMGWQRHHELIGGNLYCTVAVRSEAGEWIEKQDVGTESFTEKEKGQASDAFKRACFNLGIGRELYSAPTIWVAKGNYTANSKGSTYDRFIVTEIGYDDEGNINQLEIVNQNSGKKVYSMTGKADKPQLTEETAGDTINEDEWAEIEDLVSRANVNKPKLLQKYGYESLMQLTQAQYTALKEKCMGAIQ